MLRRRHIPLIRQLGTTDCGAACLAMLFRYYGQKVSIVDVKASINIGRNGMTLSMMKEVAEEHGFSFHAFQDYCDEENLNKNLPAIMCLKTDHYVVISKKNRTGYVILDPVEGKKTISFNYIKDNFHTVIIRLRSKEGIKYTTKTPKLKLHIDKRKFAISIFFTLLTQGLILIPPLMIQYIVDQIESNNKNDSMIILMSSALILGIIYFVFNWSKKRALLLLQNEIYIKATAQMIKKLFKIDLSFYENHSSGDLARRFNSISDIYEFFSGILILTFIDLLTALFCGALMISQSSLLFFLVAMFTLLQLSFAYIMNLKLKQKIQNYYADRSRLDGDLIEILNNISQIRSMHFGSILSSNIHKKYDASINLLKQRIQLSDVMESVLTAINIVTPIFIYVIGSYLITNNQLTLGTLIAFVTLSAYFISPFKTLSLVLPQIGNLKETIIRLKEFLNYKGDTPSGDKRIEHFEHIELKNVSYAYADRGKNDLNDINLTIEKGEKIAIVGASGSGKTTITKLLLNVFSRYTGEILLNGSNIKQIERESIDKLFGAVTQIPMAINNTIRNNIDMFGDLTDAQIYELLNLVELKNDVMGFPLKLNTFIGENGQNLSGGQKQRIAIARALASNPEIIILDEATSNLDPLTEKKIFLNLKNIEITQITVTHRLNAIQDSDRIYVVSNGEIIEHGTHDQLIKRRGNYYENILYNDRGLMSM
ncbi:peptidase domain-containing ABC transporter [Paenibacillus polymyxa]|uniref:peptidase domain-containing ABC transporter n=1 Tax=Paenibacillus TaxID=44249 RepID=UPI00202505E2|nr:peptidase domain-containing ABC transporter [Paenibacillus polymyxa]WGV33153.1 peptidase domain-containing ABC transporter [Paenibacillus polymyxa]